MPRVIQSVDPDRLRLLAKKASQTHFGGDVPMTEAVVRTVRDEPGLGPEHIRRIVEFANNETFQQMFKTATGGHRVFSIHGGPADPADVLKELNMGGTSPTDESLQLHVPNVEPYIPGADSAGDPFASVKTASEETSTSELWRHRDRLNGLRSHVESEFVGVAARFDDAVRGLCKEAQNVIREGYSPIHIQTALSKYASHPNFAKYALKLVQGHVEDMFSPALHQKVAGIPNPKHPLILAYSEFEKVAKERFRLQHILDTIDTEIDALRAEVRNHLQ